MRHRQFTQDPTCHICPSVSAVTTNNVPSLSVQALRLSAPRVKKKVNLRQLKYIYILSSPTLIQLKPSPSFLSPLTPPLPSPDCHLSLSNPCWSSLSPSFISSCWFSHAVSATTPRWRRGYWRQAYWGLGALPVHITPREWPTERRKGGIKSNLANLKLHSPTTEGFSLLFSVRLPPALFSIKQALFLNLPEPRRATWKKKTKRLNLASFPHVISLISLTSATKQSSPESSFSFSLLTLLLFSSDPSWHAGLKLFHHDVT